jgi:hypothetical protein
MSDVPEGPGWWQASDGRWYAPEQFPRAETAAPTAPTAPSPPDAPAAPAAPTTAAAPYPPGAPTPVLVQVGDIACTRDEVVTPNGRLPLRRTVWVVSNSTTTTEAIPTWAIVMTVLFVALCLLGLLFLLVKEQKTTGWMTVSVQGEGTYYSTQIPIASPVGVADVEQRVGYIRGLVAALG